MKTVDVPRTPGHYQEVKYSSAAADRTQRTAFDSPLRLCWFARIKKNSFAAAEEKKKSSATADRYCLLQACLRKAGGAILG